MCSACGRKTTFTQIVQNDGSSLPTLKYIHCKYKTQFEALFAAIGVNASEQNLPTLAAISDSGDDRKGIVKDANGNPIFFSVEDTLKKIDASKPVEKNTCTI